MYSWGATNRLSKIMHYAHDVQELSGKRSIEVEIRRAQDGGGAKSITISSLNDVASASSDSRANK